VQYNETMEKWFAALAVVIAANGCGFGSEAQPCKTDDQCHSAVKQGGQCEMSTGLCSFSDPSCESGRRYGGLAGDQSGDCVGGGVINPMIDAEIDTPPPPDAQVCFGSGLVRICLMAQPTLPLTISTPSLIDTGDTTMCTAVASGGDGYCVVVATNITISARLRGAGPKPLVLLATGTIMTMGQGVIDVGSHRAPRTPNGDPEDGAGVDSAVCAAGNKPTNSGGGAGGSFAGTGGNGAAGAANGASAGGMPAMPAAITALRAGCPGQDGNGNNKGTGGHGGGAVFLLAGTSIVIGGGINASGEGGAPGTDNTSGGGGGGAGGMIGLDAPSVTALSLLLANGGGGGEGSGQNVTGVAGADPTSVAAAPGGSDNGDPLGGDGGLGSAGAAASSGGSGHPGDFSTAGPFTNRGGGGAGGGGAGLIKAPASAQLGASVSPAATP
jgi:hypothetical protein